MPLLYYIDTCVISIRRAQRHWSRSAPIHLLREKKRHPSLSSQSGKSCSGQNASRQSACSEQRVQERTGVRLRESNYLSSTVSRSGRPAMP